MYGREARPHEARVVREQAGVFVLNIDTYSVEVPYTPKSADERRLLRASLTSATSIIAEVVGALLLIGVCAKPGV
jgi:hypothetical protein